MLLDNLSTWDILIIDDDFDSINIVEVIFGFHDVKVRKTLSSLEGLELLHQQRPTILFLDIQMPQLSGWEVLKRIREDEALKNLLVIAITAHAMSGDRERILSAGFDGYITKPISPITFLDEVKAVLVSRAPIRDNIILPDKPKPEVLPVIEQVKPDAVKPDDTKYDTPKSGSAIVAVTDQAKQGDAKPEGVKPDDTKYDTPKSGSVIVTDQAKSN